MDPDFECYSPRGPLSGKQELVREGVKNIQRGGYLKIAAEGREAVTPPKILVKYKYPP